MIAATGVSAVSSSSEKSLDKLAHIVCCHDDNRGVCGVDLSDCKWADDGEGLDCAVCEELDRVENADLSPYCTCPCCCAVPTDADNRPTT